MLRSSLWRGTTTEITALVCVCAMATLLTVEEALAAILERAAASRPSRCRSTPPPAAFSPRTRAPPSTCRRSRARRWTASPLRAEDTPGRLPVVERIAAGRPATRALEPARRWRSRRAASSPRAPTPSFPSSLLSSSDNAIEVAKSVEPGAHVRPRGGDLAAGDVVVRAGTRVAAGRSSARSPRRVSASVACARRPRAAVVSTGTELAPPGEPLEPGQIYEANGAMLAAALAAAGAVVSCRRRSRTTTPTRIAPCSSADSTPTCSSRRAASRSGRTTSCGRSRRSSASRRSSGGSPSSPASRSRSASADGTLVFGLPGNPVSSLVCFELFVRPAVLALQGAASPGRRSRRAARRAPFGATPSGTSSCARGLRVDGERVVLEPLTGQESHMIARAAAADALVLAPRGDGELAAGSTRAVPASALEIRGVPARAPAGGARAGACATRGRFAGSCVAIGPSGGRSLALG